jgi:hypothetical protein
MPEKETLERDKEQGKSPSTQAGEFIREEMHHIREGKHGARSPQQAIAIGLSRPAERASSSAHQNADAHPQMLASRRSAIWQRAAHTAATRHRPVPARP